MSSIPLSTIARGVAQNQQLTQSGQKAYVNEGPQGPPQAEGPKPALPVVSGLPVRGVFSPAMALATDIVNTSATDGIPERSTIPPPQPQTSTKTTVVKSTTVISGGSSSSSLALSTNNTPNAVQSKLNFLAGANMTITSDGSGNEVFSAAAGENIIGPGFANNLVNLTSVFVSNYINSTNNGIGGILFFLPTEITTTEIGFDVSAGDSTNKIDIGIYGPFTGTETSLPLIVNVGAAKYSATGSTLATWSQGATVLAAGYYFLMFTAASSGVTVTFVGQDAYTYLYAAVSSTTSSSSTLPAAINVPTKSPHVTGGSAGPNIPSPLSFLLA